MKPGSIACILILTTAFCVAQHDGIAQPFQATLSSLAEAKLLLSCNKTSSLIFPSVIKSVDLGSRNLLAQKAANVDNVLQLKAAQPKFEDTNLTVITADGIVHEFTVTYDPNPQQRVWQITTSNTAVVRAIFPVSMTESDLADYCSRILNSQKHTTLTKDRKNKLTLALQGVYVHNDVVFYRLQVNNRSNIHYSVDYLRFYVRDKGKVKRTATQELPLTPLFSQGNDKLIAGNTAEEFVYGLEKFTIPDAKLLIIEMFESNGGRHVALKIRNRKIVRAALIP